MSCNDPYLEALRGLGYSVVRLPRADVAPLQLLAKTGDTLGRIGDLVWNGVDLTPLERVRTHLPFAVGDYVDFYSSLEHATNLGRLFRPDAEPLLPNWRHLPVGYHGRSGTVIVSGTPVLRPSGQVKAPGDAAPRFGPSRRLDIELELGFVIGVGSRQGDVVRGTDFREHVFGVVLVNDWSAWRSTTKGATKWT